MSGRWLYELLSATVSLFDSVKNYNDSSHVGDLKTNGAEGSPVPGLEGIAGPLEEVSLHDHAIRSVNVELHLSVIVGEVLRNTHKHTHFSLGRRTSFTRVLWSTQ